MSLSPSQTRAATPHGAPLSNAPSLRADLRLLCRVATVLLVMLLLVAPVAAVLWLEPSAGKQYVTSIGEVRTVSLTSGSEVILNADSEVHVASRPRVSRLVLDHGEAYLQVGADRPLILVVGNRRIRALGAKFSVSHKDGELRVIVTEGEIEIRQFRGVLLESSQVSLSAGMEARIGRGSIAVRRPSSAEIEELLSWRSSAKVAGQTS